MSRVTSGRTGRIPRVTVGGLTGAPGRALAMRRRMQMQVSTSEGNKARLAKVFGFETLCPARCNRHRSFSRQYSERDESETEPTGQVFLAPGV